MKKALIPAIFVLSLSLLSACVTQTTVQHQLPDQPSPGDVNYRARVRTELASEYFRLGNYGVALDTVREALQLLPSYAPAHNLQGVIYMQLNDDAKAAQSFEQARRLAPNDSEILNNYGWFVCQRQNAARSMEFFQAALRNPLYQTPERALHNAGVCARKSGDIASAETQFRAALQRQPLYAPTLLEMADLLLGQGRVKEAELMQSRYMQTVGTPSADGLLMCVRIAHAVADRSSEASCVQQLRRRFPDAPQTRASFEVR